MVRRKGLAEGLLTALGRYGTRLAPMKCSHCIAGLRPVGGVWLASSLVLLLLVLAPFAVAQDVHHELAAADQDGHEHSDTDLCQWVQHHTTGSLVIAIPPLASWAAISQHEWFPVTVLVSSSFVSVGPSRAPPRS